MLWLFLLAPVITLLGAVLVGTLMWSIVRLAGSIGMTDLSNQPFFGIYVFRGLLVMLALIAALAMWSKRGLQFWEDPLLSEEAQQGYREILDPELREQREAEKRRRWEEQQGIKPPSGDPAPVKTSRESDPDHSPEDADTDADETAPAD